jgi:hypothetical protein
MVDPLMPIARSKSPIRMEDSYSHMRESTELISAFSLSFLRQLLDQILPFRSSSSSRR